MDFVGILTSPQTLGPLKLTLAVLAVAGLLHLVSGVLLGYYLTSGKGPVRQTVDFLVTLPLVFPPLPRGSYC